MKDAPAAMMDALLMAIIVGVLMLAVGVDIGALVAWLRRRRVR